jgi:dipeptidyl-peptidase-4
MKAYKRSYVFLFISMFLAYGTLHAQEKKQITIDWIFGNGPREIVQIPSFNWLENGKAIIIDSRKPAAERTFELFDPATQTAHPILDISKALTSLKNIMGEKAPQMLTNPDALSPMGDKAVYEFDNDIYLLYLNDAKFIRLTNNSTGEINIRFSPNGELIAYVRSNDIYSYDIKERKEKRLTFTGTETTLNGTLSWVYWEEIFGRSDIAYWWSDDSKAITYLSSDESKVSIDYFPDFKPATPNVIKQRYPKTGEPNPVVKAGIVEISNPKTKWINFGNFKYEYLIRIVWLPGSRQVSVQALNRAQDQVDLFFADRKTGNTKHILKETDPGWVNIHDDLYFLKNGKEFIWASERTGYAHLYRYSIEGKLLNAITSGEWAVASSGGSAYWVRSSISSIDETNGIVYFTGNEKSQFEKHLYSIKLDGTGLKRITKEEGVHLITFSPRGKYYLDNYSNIKTPPVLSLYKNDGTLVKILASYNADKLASFNLQRPEQFTIKARDGFPLPAEILKPSNFDPNKKYPLIVYVYGGPSAPQVNNAWRNSLYSDQVLIDNGYLVAIIDNRAATAVSKNLENLLLRNMGGTIELNDLVDGVRWFKQQSYIDSARVGVWGWSGGGTYTLNAMTHSKEFKAGIAVAAVTDWRFYDTRFGEIGMKTPQNNLDAYNRTSLLRSAKDLHGKLMIVHGTYDDNVHPQNAWAFIDELIKANIQYELQIYPMRKHGIADRPAKIHLYNTMLDFWKRNL